MKKTLLILLQKNTPWGVGGGRVGGEGPSNPRLILSKLDLPKGKSEYFMDGPPPQKKMIKKIQKKQNPKNKGKKENKGTKKNHKTKQKTSKQTNTQTHTL